MEVILPRVSIGMPVYNGENFIRAATSSILAQSFTDFELIISDNCSTDATRSICEEMATGDSRVRYIRQAKNIGAAPNFNILPGLARGEYFKWAAHDDLVAPNYLECCTAALDANPEASLCFTGALVINEFDEQVRLYENPLRLNGLTPENRFSELVKFHLSARYEIFGLFRMEALKGTDLIGGFTDGDGVLLAHVALRGLLVEMEEPLFFPRQHAGQSQRLIADKQAYDTWFDPANKGKLSFPHFRLLREFARVVAREPLSLHQRLLCWRSVLAEGLHEWRLLRGDLKRFTQAILSRAIGAARKLIRLN